MTNRGCRVFILGDSQKWYGHGPGSPVLADPAWAGQLDQMICRGPFQPQPFCHSVIFTSRLPLAPPCWTQRKRGKDTPATFPSPLRSAHAREQPGVFCRFSRCSRNRCRSFLLLMNAEEPELWGRGSATDTFPTRLGPVPAADASRQEEAEPRPMAAGGGLGLLPFLRLLGQLKRVPRTGWVYRNVAEPESVSDHMYRMAIMALVTEDKSLNKDRCIRLALVHDMAECIVGDIAPADNIPKEEKHRREETAMQQLTHLLSEDLRKEIYELWEGALVPSPLRNCYN